MIFFSNKIFFLHTVYFDKFQHLYFLKLSMHLTGIYCYISYNNDAIMTVTAITPHFIVRQMFRYKSKGEIIVYRNIYM